MNKSVIRWLRGLVGVVLMLFLGAMYAWSYFKVALGEAYPMWSQTQITLNFTIMMSCFCVGGLLAGGVLSRRMSKAKQVMLSGVLVGAGFLGTSFLPADPGMALIWLYLCYGILTGLGTGIAYNAVLACIQPWFPDCPGLISGALLMGMGFGSLILGNVAAVLVESVGLTVTFRIFGAAMIVIILACASAIRMPGADDHLPAPEKKTAAGDTDEFAGMELTTGQMLRRPSFWLYFLWNLCMSAGGMLVINSASSITLYFGLAAVVGLVVSVFNGLGRLAVGCSMDALGWKKTMYISNVLFLLAGILLCVGDRLAAGVVVLIGMLVVGICYGGGITISAALIRKLYGVKYYASNFSVCMLCLIPASILGPILSAALQDASGGGYRSTFVMVAVMGAGTMVVNFLIRKP